MVERNPAELEYELTRERGTPRVFDVKLIPVPQGGETIDGYVDEAVGEMTKNDAGRMWVSKITLNPAITFSGSKRPTPAQLDELHHLAHDECYIANSIKTEVVVNGAVSFA